MASKGMLKGVFNSNAKRGKVWNKYYSDVKPQKEVHDFVHKECLHCGKEMILDYKERNRKFCSLSCSTTHRNLKDSKTKGGTN